MRPDPLPAPEMRLSWKVYHILSDPIHAVSHYTTNHSTGQLILHLNQGKVCTVEWRERVKDAPPDESS